MSPFTSFPKLGFCAEQDSYWQKSRAKWLHEEEEEAISEPQKNVKH